MLAWLSKGLGERCPCPGRESSGAEVTSREGDQGIAPAFVSLSTSQGEDNDANHREGAVRCRGPEPAG